MYQKRYGKIRFGAWLNAELEQSNPIWMIVFGALLCICGISVRVFSGAPFSTLLTLGVSAMVPPAWVMCLLWSVSFFLIGAAFGFVLFYKTCSCNEEKYKGGMLFILLAVLELCWYPCFFAGRLVFISCLLSVLILCAAVATAVCFFRVSKFSGILLGLHTAFLIYLLFLNFAVLFTA